MNPPKMENQIIPHPRIPAPLPATLCKRRGGTWRTVGRPDMSIVLPCSIPGILQPIKILLPPVLEFIIQFLPVILHPVLIVVESDTGGKGE